MLSLCITEKFNGFIWIFDKNVLTSKGEIKIACAGNSKLSETGSVNLCNIVFTIDADADLGETPVSLESFYAGNGTEKLTIDSVNGMINVLSKATETNKPDKYTGCDKYVNIFSISQKKAFSSHYRKVLFIYTTFYTLPTRN